MENSIELQKITDSITELQTKDLLEDLVKREMSIHDKLNDTELKELCLWNIAALCKAISIIQVQIDPIKIETEPDPP